MLEGLLLRTIWKGTTERSGTVKIKTLLVIRANFNQSGTVGQQNSVFENMFSIKKAFSIDLCSSFYDINVPVLIEQSTFHIQTTCSCQEFVKDHWLVQPEVHSLNPGKMDSQDHMIKWFGKSICYAGRKWSKWAVKPSCGLTSSFSHFTEGVFSLHCEILRCLQPLSKPGLFSFFPALTWAVLIILYFHSLYK